MKKLILSLAFVFAVGSFSDVNANGKIENEDFIGFTLDPCFDKAINALEADEAKYGAYSDDKATKVLNLYYAWCWLEQK